MAIHEVRRLELQLTDTIDPESEAIIDDGLTRYNREKAGFVDARPLAVLVRDTQEVVGGLIGRIEPVAGRHLFSQAGLEVVDARAAGRRDHEHLIVDAGVEQGLGQAKKGVAPDQMRIGLPVHVEFARIDDDLTLPAWRAMSSTALPPRVIEVTPTFVISSALATRDFQDVHHDRDRAIAGGAKDIFLNILTTTGLVQRYVAGWAGPDAIFRAISIRLGVPCHAGETLTLTGEVTADDGAERVISIIGRCGLGDHVTATVRLASVGNR